MRCQSCLAFWSMSNQIGPIFVRCERTQRCWGTLRVGVKIDEAPFFHLEAQLCERTQLDSTKRRQNAEKNDAILKS